ncbi:MAG: imelysin family protein [Mucilaginibacter sp.]|uniref:imelysin family protein n=1 Tax=Mucilaginibacter sp. TaxID=1882438 RepID=UPI0031B10889
MNRSITKVALVALPLTLLGLSCSKSNNNPTDTSDLKTEILTETAANVCTASYEDMYAKTQDLLSSVTTLNTTTTDANLAAARDKWKAIRTTWEQTEGWLFGPIEANNIDPRIDTWPVDFNALDNVLKSSNTLNEAYINSLDESLKGFHPVEYILWGKDGNKTAGQFTAREKEYLLGLTQNLLTLAKEVRDVWTTGGYQHQLANAGKGSTEFTTQQAAYVQIVDAMNGICDEVANGKMKEPFDAQDPNLEESPFAKNSIIDFTNNINGVLDIYQGRFIKDGKGLEDLVRTNNLSLDTEIKSKHAAAVAALKAITVPFGVAITTQQSLVQNAMIKVNDLATVLNDKLKPYVIQYVK